MEISCKLPTQLLYSYGKNPQYLLDSRLSGSQSQSGWCEREEKICCPGWESNHSSICSNIQNHCILPTECVYGYFVWFSRINCDYFPKQYYPGGLCNGDTVYILWSRKLIFKHYLENFQASEVEYRVIFNLGVFTDVFNEITVSSIPAIQTVIFWVKTPRRLVGRYCCFGWTRCLPLHGWSVQGEDVVKERWSLRLEGGDKEMGQDASQWEYLVGKWSF
jgi:hypothetical protein